MKKLTVLGIMSGTSLGSVDYAVCEINGRSVKLKELWAVNYPAALQDKLHAAARGDLKSWEFSQMHHDLGRFYAKHALRSKAKPALAGLHGQTIFHNPSRKNPATFQLGESAYLSQSLNIPVVNNFRAMDMTVGGQGAPLATIFHEYVFAVPGKHICVNNLGGISNVTSLHWRKSRSNRPAVLAFDTGPANMLMDFAMRHFSGGKATFDRGGLCGTKGSIHSKLVQKWLKHPYFRKGPPKSTGRELFGEPFFNKAIEEMRTLSQHDVLATLTEFTAASLALNYKLHLADLPDRIILTGGGASNPFLKDRISQQDWTPGKIPDVITSEDLGWPVEAIEPAAFALLAYLRFFGLPGNLPVTTGARKPVLCGTITVL